MRYAVLAIGVLGVASAALFARYGLTAGASAEALSAWRLVLAAAALILFRRFVPARTRLPKNDYWRAAAAGIFLALHFATWIGSLAYVSVARSTLLVSTAPLWAGLVGLAVPALRPKALFWLGLIVAAAGTLLVTSQAPHSATLRDPAWVGDLLAIAGAICLVPYLLISQRLQKQIDTLSAVTWIYGFAAASLVGYLVVTGNVAPPSEPATWLSIIGMAVFAQLVGHSSLNRSLRFFSTAQVATATLLEPVFAGLLAWALLGERISAMQAVGAAILLIGVALSLTGPGASVATEPEY